MTREVDEVSLNASETPVAKKRTKMSTLRAEKAAIQAEADKLAGQLADAIAAKDSTNEEIVALRNRIGHADAQILSERAAMQKLREENNLLKGTVEGMRMHAEIQGEPNSTVSPIPPVTRLSNRLLFKQTACLKHCCKRKLFTEWC